MAKKKSSKRSASKTYLSVYGVPEMVDRIEAALGDPREALDRAYKAGMAVPEGIMLDWFAREEKSLHPHKVTGRTADSFQHGKLVWTKGGYAEYRYGFLKDKGGLNAVFFEYGTPKIKPQFVMYYAVHNNIDLIESELVAELHRVLQEKGLA